MAFNFDDKTLQSMSRDELIATIRNMCPKLEA